MASPATRAVSVNATCILLEEESDGLWLGTNAGTLRGLSGQQAMAAHHAGVCDVP